MKFKEVIIDTTSEGIEFINGILIKLNIAESVIEDKSVFEDFINSDTMNWDYYDENVQELQDCKSKVKVYLAENEQGENELKLLKSEITELKKIVGDVDLGSLDISINIVDDEDWANNWKEYFKPFVVGKKIIVKPTWELVENTDERIVLEIDPGSSFGTGQHFTTQLCIEEIEKNIKENMNILDMGCGSGILSIAAILLGAKSVVAVDIDENATKIAKENIKQNNISDEKFSVFCGNVIEDKRLQDKIEYNKYDMICVNIIADIIIEMSYLFPRFLKKGGIIVASGIIEKYVDKVKFSFEKHGIKVNYVGVKDEWYCITGVLE